jgi:hypothetical protein
MTTEYTQNFKLNLPDFRMGPWHDLINNNTVTIDEILMSVIQGVDTRPWTNNTVFTVGMTCIDTVDNTFWVCSVTHTSAPAPTTFAQDRAAHPTYWARVVVGIAPRGEWANSTHYLPNDMVSDSNEGVIAVCKTEHTSSAAPATIRTDAVYWTFVADMHGASDARYVIYHNNVSGVPSTNVQDALDLGFATDATQNSNITKNTTDITNLTTRVTNTENVNAGQTTAINTNTSDITLIKGEITNINNAGYLTDAPNDGLIYARQSKAWTKIDTASVLVSDSAPVGAARNALWFNGNTGLMYINYWDGDSAQWVIVPPSGSANSIGAVAYTAQAATAAQQTVTRQNVYAAPFDALAYNGMQINGSVEVSQQIGTTGIIVPGFAADRWLFDKVGTAAIGASTAKAAVFPGFSNFMNLYISTPQAVMAPADYILVAQRIEGYRISRLQWGTANAQPITIGFWAQHAVAGTYTVTVRNSPATRGYAATYTQNVANTQEYKIVTIPGCIDGTWANDNTTGIDLVFVCAAGSSNQTAPNVWNTTALAAATGQVNGATIASTAFRITGLIVLPGIEAPNASRLPYIMRPYDQELTNCLRYWRKDWIGLDAAYPYAGMGIFTQIAYTPRMRAIPTLTYGPTIQQSNNTAPNNGGFGDNSMMGIQISNVGAGRAYWYGPVTSDAQI